MEVSAYVSNLRMMINWLRENCRETNLSDAERRLRALEQVAERYTVSYTHLTLPTSSERCRSR
ncbi:MAG: hypothetical protein QUT30_09170, partial [Acidobacteriota bacterium]|nr:hypothetical protein [Acidobacteriota bacterium]